MSERERGKKVDRRTFLQLAAAAISAAMLGCMDVVDIESIDEDAIEKLRKNNAERAGLKKPLITEANWEKLEAGLSEFKEKMSRLEANSLLSKISERLISFYNSKENPSDIPYGVKITPLPITHIANDREQVEVKLELGGVFLSKNPSEYLLKKTNQPKEKIKLPDLLAAGIEINGPIDDSFTVALQCLLSFACLEIIIAAGKDFFEEGNEEIIGIDDFEKIDQADDNGNERDKKELLGIYRFLESTIFHEKRDLFGLASLLIFLQQPQKQDNAEMNTPISNQGGLNQMGQQEFEKMVQLAGKIAKHFKIEDELLEFKANWQKKGIPPSQGLNLFLITPNLQQAAKQFREEMETFLNSGQKFLNFGSLA